MSITIEDELLGAAQEIAEAGHNGWGNTMLTARDEIESLKDALAKARNEALEEAAQVVAKMPLPSEHADTSLMAAVLAIRALKTEEKE
jgi:CHASE3 domain sensor protein